MLLRWALGGLFLTAACASTPPTPPAKPDKPKKKVELPEILGDRTPRGEEPTILPARPAQSKPVAIVGATLLLGTGQRIADGAIVFDGGKITAIGASTSVQVPSGATVIEGRGKFVTPGLIDTHSHLGVYASPGTFATADGNEMTDPTTPYVFSEHSFWPQDPGLERAVAGGVTTIQVLPGSGNVIGGKSVILHMTPRRETRAMRFPGAPFGLKMACGENPKRVYGTKGAQPMSRMGSIFKLRAAFIAAQSYRHKQLAQDAERARWQQKYDEAKKNPDDAEDPGKEPFGPDRNLGSETLADVMDGKINVHVHCYRADEMLQMIALSKELGFKVRSFHHAVEAYKIADVLAKENVGASMWSDWWGFKLEAYDGIEENVAMMAAAGAKAIVHSDSAIGIQRLNQEASKAYFAGRRAGIQISEDMAIQWITLNPAWALGIDDKTGSLESGKLADIVVWDHSPMSIYARAEKVFVAGDMVFDRDKTPDAWSDFEVGSDVQGVHR